MTTIVELLVLYGLAYLGAPALANRSAIPSFKAVGQYFENFLDLGEFQLRNVNYTGLNKEQRAIRNLAAMTYTKAKCYTVMPSNINISAVSLL